MGEDPTRQETGPVRAVSAAPGGGKQRDAAAAEGTRRRRRAKAAGGGGCGKTGAVRSGGEAPQAGKTKDAGSGDERRGHGGGQRTRPGAGMPHGALPPRGHGMMIHLSRPPRDDFPLPVVA